jgi:hypothetical protein
LAIASLFGVKIEKQSLDDRSEGFVIEVTGFVLHNLPEQKAGSLPLSCIAQQLE